MASRARTAERRKEREEQKKRQRQLTFLIGAGVVVAVFVVLLVLLNQPAEAPIPDYSAARYEGIPQSTTDQGFPVLGKADAPVEVIEYSSFDCPHCRDFHEQALPSLIDRVRAGEIKITYVPVYGTGGIQNGQGAARAAICVGEQGEFWEFHDALFTWQGDYANTAFSQNRIYTGLTNLGIDRAQWDACMGSDRPNTITEAARSSMTLQNLPGTPAVLVNGTLVANLAIETINQAINEALATSGIIPVPIGAESTAEPVAPVVEATAEMTAEPVMEATAEMTTDAVTEADATAEPEPVTEATAEATASS
jgi:protein-disulfide isomerase